jgi:hypothetical protein
MIPSRLAENPQNHEKPGQLHKIFPLSKGLCGEEEDNEISAESKQFDTREKRIRGPMKCELQQADGDEPEEGPVQRAPLNPDF